MIDRTLPGSMPSKQRQLDEIKTFGDPRYALDLFLRVITVDIETMKIVRALPELAIE